MLYENQKARFEPSYNLGQRLVAIGATLKQERLQLITGKQLQIVWHEHNKPYLPSIKREFIKSDEGN